jgi:predicted nucleic acid-binding protein
MKVFLDTNIIMEFLSKRKLYVPVDIIIRSTEEDNIGKCISACSFDTLVYLLGIELKKKDIHEPEKRKKTRELLNAILDNVNVADINGNMLRLALNDEHFTDIEDAIQYYCALANDCDCLITINVKHFKNANKGLEVLDPAEFVNKYILLED